MKFFIKTLLLFGAFFGGIYLAGWMFLKSLLNFIECLISGNVSCVNIWSTIIFCLIAIFIGVIIPFLLYCFVFVDSHKKEDDKK